MTNKCRQVASKQRYALYKVFREDYRDYSAISYREAADYSGLSINQLQWLVSLGEVKRADKHGPYKLSRESLKAYLCKGKEG